jgi:hypothetical protein
MVARPSTSTPGASSNGPGVADSTARDRDDVALIEKIGTAQLDR